jgi:hypothetical protein
MYEVEYLLTLRLAGDRYGLSIVLVGNQILPDIHTCHDGRPTVMTFSYRPVLGHMSAALAPEW